MKHYRIYLKVYLGGGRYQRVYWNRIHQCCTRYSGTASPFTEEEKTAHKELPFAAEWEEIDEQL